MLELKHLSVLEILRDVSVTVAQGEWLMVVGPNGAGKSTMINAVAQGIAYTGSVRFQGRDVAAMKPLERARCMGVLMQQHMVGYSFTVEEVVRLGRYAHTRGMFAGASDEDDDMVERALHRTGMADQRGQSVLTLSGGELQRTFLAQLLAQDPRILLLDEPSNHLDLVYQRQVFDLVREWLEQPGRAVVSVVHDLSLAMAYGTRALLLHGGKAVAQGAVGEVLSRGHLEYVYEMDVSDWMRRMLAQWETMQD